MAALTLSELKKRAGRIESLVRLFSEGHLFEMEKDATGKISNKKFKISGIILTKSKTSWQEFNVSDVKSPSQRKILIQKIRNHAGTLQYNGYYQGSREEVEVNSSYMKKSSEFGGGGAVKKAGGGGGSESMGIRAETMILGGKLEKVKFAGQPVECRTFTSSEQLVDSIIDGLNTNTKVPKYIVEDFNKYKKSKKYDTFEWNESIPDNEMNQLGKYAGEVITGVVGMKTSFRRALSPNILKTNQVVKFCVPTDPAFTGVDVFFLMKDGDVVPVSNKYGKGAAASFFANVLPKAMKSKLKPSPLKDFVKVAEQFATAEKMEGRGAPSKEILYEYGCRNLLKIPKSKLPEPYKEVYEAIRAGKQTPGTRLVIAAIEKYSGVDAVVLKNLPNSVTAFFCREVAKTMNKSKPAIDDLKEILAGKNYFQANLHINDWFAGKVNYKIVNSGDVKVDIIGSKAPTTDITAKQGLINYFMTLP